MNIETNYSTKYETNMLKYLRITQVTTCNIIMNELTLHYTAKRMNNSVLSKLSGYITFMWKDTRNLTIRLRKYRYNTMR